MLNFIKNLFGLGGAKGYENISASDFEKLLSETSDAVLIDVRSTGEFNAGHLPKAHNHDIMSGAFQRKVATLDKDKTYFLYCRSGNRAGIAKTQLTALGYTNISNHGSIADTRAVRKLPACTSC